MKTLIILTIGLLMPILNFGQSELAMTSATDGFVNVRANKSTDSKILFKIKETEFFLCEPTEDNWWKIDNFYTKTGFVHKSKIQLIKDLKEKQQRALIINSINQLRDYRIKYDSLRLILPNEEIKELLSEFENFEETNYTPLLPFLSGLFCKNKDIDLLDNYLKIMNDNQKSANEMPAWSLGDCYLCQPDLVIKRIDNYRGKDREYLWSMLTLGFENVTWKKESEIEDYDELKNRLNK
ncbi:SH3 domain-containing protein [Plebeiibacterium marinum]|uniref:SH3 domain-containing protein n=1 Tax=Plebeiibacterium marinum TaxID=2992111 RepID=A0AAE3SLL5_9BACT|nr:SH3 domain-containing protein [Plebeiobacterium marinum]MCW3807995.1 SH3 domain-containing protein [Plebeiobacterium marinum]